MITPFPSAFFFASAQDASDALPVRFTEKFAVTERGCWEWTAFRTWKGYGRFRLGERLVYAHRFAYELLVGRVPDGRQLDHLCKNRACVNPAHPEPVTPLVNVRRGSGTTLTPLDQVCKNGHREVVQALRTVRCRACERERYARATA